MSTHRLSTRALPQHIRRITKPSKALQSQRSLSTKPQMALFPRMSSFGPMRQEFGPFFNLFNDTFSELQKISDSASRAFAPKFDVKEAKDNYLLEGELPGIDQKNVTIEFLDDQTLTIKGHTEHRREEGQRPAASTVEGENHNETGSGPESSESKEVTTTGSNSITKHDPQHTYWVSERSVGEFARSFTFPSPVDHERVKASLKEGILSVVVPKLQKQNTTRKITIE